MTISATPAPYQLPAAAEVERAALVLKKQQDVSKGVGQALVALIEKSSSNETSGSFSAYA